MGEVKTKLTIVDNASAKLNKINKQLTLMNGLFGTLAMSSRAFGTNLNDTANKAVRAKTAVESVSNASNKAATSMRNNTNQVHNYTKSVEQASKSTDGLIRRLKGLAATYLGVMGVRTAFNTADTITAANNKFTTLATMQYGMDDAATQNFSAETMDKIYASAQSAATSYTDMMSNVAKSVTLAGKAFGSTQEQQIDNAIKFQEIMAKSYALGGASAAEQSSSMYQMVQALGSGVLQGDELRSVREGAPLAYQAIEEFAQGVLNTDESLKDLASQGLITSNLVVSAILDMQGETDKAFENIELTWAQIWNKFKNSSVKAFDPFLKKLREIGNSPGFEKLMSNIESTVQAIASNLTGALNIVQSVIDFMADHWNTMTSIMIVSALALAAVIGVRVVNSILKLGEAFKKLTSTNKKLLIALAIFAALYIATNYLVDATGSLSSALAIITGLLFIIAVLWLVVGTTGNWVIGLFLIGLILLATAFFVFMGNIMGGLNVFKTFFVKVGQSISAAWNVLCNNMSLGFENTILGVKSWFYGLLETATEVIAKIATKLNKLPFVSIDTQGLYDTANDYAQKQIDLQNQIDINNANKKDVRDEWAKIWNDGWVEEAYDEGYAIGQGWKQSLDNWLTGTTSKLGGGGFDAVAESNTDGLLDGVNETADNTGAMSKSMELSNEYLKYLRQVAEMESINKFTTAEIKVDMTNNNTMNNMGDLDGIVTHLSTKLREELEVVANGVHI